MASFNTMAGCFLASALFAMVIGKVSNALGDVQEPAKPAIAVSEAAPEAAAGDKPAEVPPIGPKLKDANVQHGEAIFKQQCFTCHTIDKGAPNKIGPNQWDLVGRKKASEDGFSYSPAVQKLGGAWDYEDINRMIFKPQQFARGTKMAFAGLPKEQDRADVIAYLRTMHDQPLPPLP
jgi:cytochrome c